MQAPRLRAEACSRVSKMLSESYAETHAALADPSNGYVADGDVSSYVKHTPAQVSAPNHPRVASLCCF